MGNIVSANALMKCSFGTIPSPIAPNHCMMIQAQGMIANAMDMTPANIPSFGMCTSMVNPTVASATAAALGVLTPQPCMCMAAGTWITPKTTILAKGFPVLSTDAKLMCAYAGIITFQMSPSMKVKL